jgi:hypothetical protein
MLKNMKLAIIVGLALAISFASMALPTSAVPEEGQYFHVTQMVVEFDRTDAMVTISYDLDLFAEIYAFILGSRNLEPTFEQIFSDFENVKVTEIGRNHAVIMLSDVSRQDGDYYLHDQHQLGIWVDSLILVYPNGSNKNFQHTNTIQDTFYKQV